MNMAGPARFLNFITFWMQRLHLKAMGKELTWSGLLYPEQNQQMNGDRLNVGHIRHYTGAAAPTSGLDE